MAPKLPNTPKCAQIPSKFFRPFPNSRKCPQKIPNASKCCQMLPNEFNYPASENPNQVNYLSGGGSPTIQGGKAEAIRIKE